jgi:hypothetical protein
MRDIKASSRALGDGVHVLVAAAGEVDEQDRVLLHRGRHLHRLRDRVRRLERRDDAFGAAQLVERRERLVVGHRDVLGALAVLQPRVLGPTPG